MGRRQRAVRSESEVVCSVQEATALILQHRLSLGFMTVARAMLVRAAHEQPRRDIEVAQNLGISPQTHHHWLHNELDTWLSYWSARLVAVANRSSAQKSEKCQRLTEHDLKWIARVVQNVPVSWAKRAREVRRLAGADPNRGHLKALSRVTLWRKRNQITRYSEQLRMEGNTGFDRPALDFQI